MTQTAKTRKAPTITVKVISLKSDFEKAFDPNSFLEWHNYAVKKSNGALKPLTANEIKKADYAVIATYDNGKSAGQCLLFNAANGADRIQPYLDYLDDADNSIILTSLSGTKAVPAILEAVQHSPTLAEKHICAKTKASNDYAKTAFESAGFRTEGPTTVQGDNYESYHYHADNTTLPVHPQIVVPKLKTTTMHVSL